MSAPLLWDATLGIGYYPVDPADWPYDGAYFHKYETYAATECGRAIAAYRLGLARQFAAGQDLLDYGIGCGTFLEAWRAEGGRGWGWDVNPTAQAWLAARGLLRVPTAHIEAVTFWDSFEHLPRPDRALEAVRRIALLSLPIFRDAAHVQRSRHFRPTEHYWYFTRDGLVNFMANEGFALAYEGDGETRAGREDILTFAFERRSGP